MISNVFCCILAYTDGIADISSWMTHLLHRSRYLSGVGAQISGPNFLLAALGQELTFS